MRGHMSIKRAAASFKQPLSPRVQKYNLPSVVLHNSREGFSYSLVQVRTYKYYPYYCASQPGMAHTVHLWQCNDSGLKGLSRVTTRRARNRQTKKSVCQEITNLKGETGQSEAGKTKAGKLGWMQMRQSDRVWVKDWEETGEQVGGEDKVCQESDGADNRMKTRMWMKLWQTGATSQDWRNQRGEQIVSYHTKTDVHMFLQESLFHVNTYRHLPLAKQLKKYVDPICKHNVKWLQDHFQHS